jgi:hypothetical protein
MLTLKIAGYRVLYDKPEYPSSYSQAVLVDGRLVMTYIRASDGAKGLQGSMVHSADMGATWSAPVAFGPAIATPEASNQTTHVVGLTEEGKILAVGYIIEKGIDEGKGYRESVKWRPNSVLIGLGDPKTLAFEWTKYPQFTFGGESFCEPGLISRTGRLVMTCWGANKQGDNWGAGVLISDDHGRTWRFKQSALEGDLKIRKSPDMPAGYNEQTLFELHSGRLVSIIRGRDHLGEIYGSCGSEAWYSRAYSDDRGETWSKPELTNLAGTGGSQNGMVLGDGSMVMASRIPCFWTQNEEHWLAGLHLSRSFDEGKTWTTQHLVTRTPAGKPFKRYYDVMNGKFVKLAPDRWLYVFGNFNHTEKLDPTFVLELEEGVGV